MPLQQNLACGVVRPPPGRGGGDLACLRIGPGTFRDALVDAAERTGGMTLPADLLVRSEPTEAANP
ncbi:MAG TPA: hypothetical protein PKO09_07320 [Anaerolineae bacterium]|nr:hypothetical protein [Anaerolineae bacterium]